MIYSLGGKCASGRLTANLSLVVLCFALSWLKVLICLKPVFVPLNSIQILPIKKKQLSTAVNVIMRWGITADIDPCKCLAIGKSSCPSLVLALPASLRQPHCLISWTQGSRESCSGQRHLHVIVSEKLHIGGQVTLAVRPEVLVVPGATPIIVYKRVCYVYIYLVTFYF